MGYNTFLHAKITGICSVVPKNGICLEDELEYFDGNIKKAHRMTKMIGIDCRRIADAGVTAADLCQQATEHLFADMNIERESIDALIFISQNPDYAMPATACILQDKLKLSKEIAAFDVNQGCTAYVYGLWLASSLVESGACKRVLLCVGESGAQYTDSANRILAPIFGDCGTATIIDYAEEEQPSYYAIGTDGSGAEALIVPIGHARIPLYNYKIATQALGVMYDGENTPWRLGYTFMDGAAIYEFTMSVVPDHIKKFMSYVNKNEADFDYLVLHQANKQIASNIADKVGFPAEKTPVETLTKFGNQAGASVVCVLCDQLKDVINSKTITPLISTFGIGLSWASCSLTLENTFCADVYEYETAHDHPTPDDVIRHWEEKIKNHYKK